MSQLYEMQQLDKIKAICQVAETDMSKLSEVRTIVASVVGVWVVEKDK
jgi:hypothetical protein